MRDKRFLVVPGAHDEAFSARIIQKLGFETYFIGGFPAVGARDGVPESASRALARSPPACATSWRLRSSRFVDGGDGYGDVKTWCTPCRAIERMGV